MSESIIDRLYKDNQALVTYLRDAGEISLQINTDGNFRKILLLSAASYFESLLTDHIVKIFSDRTNGAEPIIEFIKNKAISHQWYSYFAWDRSNANQFFGLFGPKFKDFMTDQVDNNTELEASIRAFLELGNLRNQLAHRNLANFPLEKTADEIYELYQNALTFVEVFPQRLRDFLDNKTASNGNRPADD